MGSGMLWAAIGGGAKAGMEVLDAQTKRADDDRRREQSIMDRRDALLFEMKAKADYARQEEEAAADASSKIAERGAAIGNERGAKELEAARSSGPSEGEFANDRITPEMIAEMPPAARAVYEKEMGLTDDTPLQGMRDQISASREIGAPASIRKGLLDSYNTEVKSAKDQRELDRKTQADENRYQQGERRLDQNETRMAQQASEAARRADISERRMASAISKGGSGKSEATEALKYLDSSRKSLDSAASDLRKTKEAEMENAGFDRTKKAAIEAEYAPRLKDLEARRKVADERYEKLGAKVFGDVAPADRPTASASAAAPAPAASSVAAKPATRDNGPIAPKSQAEFNALPKGALFVNPKDGKTYRKN